MKISNDDVDAIQPQHFLDMDKAPRKRGAEGEADNFGAKKKRRGKARSKDAGSQHSGGAKTMVICSICRKTFTKRVFQVSFFETRTEFNKDKLQCQFMLHWLNNIYLANISRIPNEGLVNLLITNSLQVQHLLPNYSVINMIV